MNTTNTGLKTLFNFSLMLVMICSPISTAFSQQTLSSNCASLTRMEIKTAGILGQQGSKDILLPNDTKRVTIECTCRDTNPNVSICPNNIIFTRHRPNGTTQNITATRQSVTAIGYTGDMESSIYRAVYNGAATKVTYNAPLSATARSGMRGLVVWEESEGGTPNIPNKYRVDRFLYSESMEYYINVPQSSCGLTRNFIISVPVHEHGSDGRHLVYQVRGYNGSSQVTPTMNVPPITANNSESEIRLDQIPLNNVPANVNRIQVYIESPDNFVGTSIIVGSILATSTSCCPPELTCPSNITRSTNTGRCDYTIQGGELDPTFSYSAAPTNNYNGNATLAGATFPVGTTVVTWSASGETCQVTITVQDNEAPVLTCPPDMTIIAEAGICEGFAEWETTVSDNCGATVTWSHQSGDAFPIGMTTVTGTATDAAGNTDTCEFDVTVVQCDTCVTTMTIIHIDDNDVMIGTNDSESFWENPLYRFLNPGLPTLGILTNITLELYARVFDGSCESDIEVRVTDPMGNETIFEQPFGETCSGKGLYHVVLDLPDVPLTGNSVGIWYIEFRDTNDQNVGAAEYSARFARLIYDATFDECYNTERISTYNENELLSELSEIRLYPVPTSDILNMEYTSDEDNDLLIQIFDSAGRVVSHQKESVILGVNTFNMQVHNLAQGAYYLRIMDNAGRTQVKPFTKVTP